MRLRIAEAGKCHKPDATEIRKLYDNYFSKGYDKHMRGHYAAMERLIHRLRRNFNGRILDPSCGTGEALKIMLEMFGGDTRLLMGNDFSEGMMANARTKLINSGTLFTTFDAASMNLASNTIGTVFCSYTFNWFVDKTAVAREFRRVLVSEGTLVAVEEFPLIVNNSRYMPHTLKDRIEAILKKTKLSGLDELIRIMREAGLVFTGEIAIERIDGNHDMYGLVFQKP